MSVLALLLLTLSAAPLAFAGCPEDPELDLCDMGGGGSSCDGEDLDLCDAMGGGGSSCDGEDLDLCDAMGGGGSSCDGEDLDLCDDIGGGGSSCDAEDLDLCDDIAGGGSSCAGEDLDLCDDDDNSDSCEQKLYMVRESCGYTEDADMATTMKVVCVASCKSQLVSLGENECKGSMNSDWNMVAMGLPMCPPETESTPAPPTSTTPAPPTSTTPAPPTPTTPTPPTPAPPAPAAEPTDADTAGRSANLAGSIIAASGLLCSAWA